MEISNLEVGQSISFDILPATAAVLGSSFKNVTFEGEISPRMAVKERDIVALHIAIYPTLPQGTPNNAYQYNYIGITHPSGQFEIIPVPAIRKDSIEAKGMMKITMVFNNRSQTDLTHITQVLSGIGQVPDSVTTA